MQRERERERERGRGRGRERERERERLVTCIITMVITAGFNITQVTQISWEAHLAMLIPDCDVQTLTT